MARSANFVNSEKQLLVQLISEHPQLESKRTDKVSVVQKNLAWKQIEAKFNATGTLCRRTEKNLKDAWKNIKNKAKQDNAQRKRHLRQTGGGPGVPTDELSEKVEALIPRQINCLANNFDDDNQIESSLEEQTYTLVSVAEESSSFSDGNESAVLQTLSTDRQCSSTMDDLRRRVLTEKLEAMAEERKMRREEHDIKMEYYRKKIAKLE
ncbi:myb/SANT-like DNA-binding domain-containing protein 3 isoform X1 [Styela clava]